VSERPVAIVTGGATGIGFAAARRLALDGYEAVIVNRRSELGRAAAERIVTDGGAARNVAFDICDARAVANFFARQPRVDALVNCAGAFLIRPFPETTVQQWRTLLDVNLRGLWSMCRQSLERMQAGGAIVNVASRAYLGSAQLAAYGSSKAAVIGLTRALALEIVDRRISVNAIAPGMIETPLLRESLDPAAFAAARAQQPGGYMGTPEDVAKAVAFLIDSAPFVTGQVICVDGGKSVATAYLG
jgi:3-oxoacyl-[acyl-carrier protein] reductase